MIKDRLAALHAQREDDETELVDDVSLSIDDEGEMVNFLKEVEEVRQMIDNVKDNINAVKKMQSEILSSSQPDGKVKQNLDDQMAKIKKTANNIRTRIKAMEATALDNSSSGAQERMKMTQHSTLNRLFVETMMEYSHVQNDYRERCKARIQRQLAITGHETTSEELEDMLEKGNVDIFTQGIIIETQQARQSLLDIEARHADIVKLETSIKELHDLFFDMATLVNSQGELVDSIQRHVEQAGRFVTKGKETVKKAEKFLSRSRKGDLVDSIESHVQQAQEHVENAKEETKASLMYQSKARRKKIILIICLIVALLIVAIIIAVNVS